MQCFTLKQWLSQSLMWGLGLIAGWLLVMPTAQAETLAQRVIAFPDWQSKPTVQPASGDVFYPAWLAGQWRVESTLVDLAAPLAPEIVTPGFERNRDYLEQSIAFAVRFIAQPKPINQRGLAALKALTRQSKGSPIIADRAFNGLNIARAYLADEVQAVKMDRNEPNRQITLLRGDRQLISTITGRAVETPAPDRFITSEIFQQLFRGGTQPYLNQVETTTAYQRAAVSADEQAVTAPLITADQITAIYLSPQDPHYFQAQERPVALYRYRLKFFPIPG
jgi:hypothetical protein